MYSYKRIYSVFWPPVQTPKERFRSWCRFWAEVLGRLLIRGLVQGFAIQLHGDLDLHIDRWIWPVIWHFEMMGIGRCLHSRGLINVYRQDLQAALSGGLPSNLGSPQPLSSLRFNKRYFELWTWTLNRQMSVVGDGIGGRWKTTTIALYRPSVTCWPSANLFNIGIGHWNAHIGRPLIVI